MLKKFELLSRGNKVVLEILEKVSEYKIIVNIKSREVDIREEEALICQLNGKIDKLYLKVDDKYLQIADKNYKVIADWIWENIQDKKRGTNAYFFSSYKY